MFDLTLGDEVQFTFNVNLAGTSAKPTEVRGILGNSLKMCIVAKPTSENEYLFTIPVLREFFKPGPTTFVIEVLVNGKIFSPVKREILILSEDEQISVILPATQNTEQESPAVVEPEVRNAPVEVIAAPVAEEIKETAPVTVIENKVTAKAVKEKSNVSLMKSISNEISGYTEEPKTIIHETTSAPVVETPIVETEKNVVIEPIIEEVKKPEKISISFAPIKPKKIVEKIVPKNLIDDIFKSTVFNDDAESENVVAISEVKVIRTQAPFKMTKTGVVLK